LGKSGGVLDKEKQFRGGELNLLSIDEQRKPSLLHKVVPETGLCVVFPHMTVHEGCSLKQGRKCAIRNDILYELVSGDNEETTPEPGLLTEEGQH
jgi:hypothetical protein